MSVLCVLAMREGSRGLKNKNIKKINKKPFFYYTLDQVKKINFFDEVVITTDSEKIIKLSEKQNVNFCIKRNKKLSSDSASKIDVIIDALIKSEKKFNKKFLTIFDLDVTSPLRTIKDIKNAYSLFLKNNSNNLITACESYKNPYFNMIEIRNGIIRKVKKNNKIINNRQKAPKIYDMNASIYIWTRKALKDKMSLFNKKTTLYIMPRTRSIDIDNDLDFKIVKMLLLNE